MIKGIKMAGIRDMLKRFGDAMTASAFAEEGEAGIAREILSRDKNSWKNVVLGTDTLEISPKALGYAAGLSCRMGAGLEILHLISPDDKGDMDAGPGTLVGGGVGLTEVTQRPEGGRTIYHVVPWRGTLIDGLLHILEGRRDIISIVIGRPVQGNKRLSGLLKRLGCPVIIPEKGAA